MSEEIFIEENMGTPTGVLKTLINMQQIVRIADTRDGTYLRLTNGETIKIEESYSDIINIINKISKM